MVNTYRHRVRFALKIAAAAVAAAGLGCSDVENNILSPDRGGVPPAARTNSTLSPDSVTLRAGHIVRFHGDRAAGRWAANRGHIANDGSFTALDEGTYIVTLVDGLVFDTARITVVPRAERARSLEISPIAVTLTAGEVAHFSASDAAGHPVRSHLRWNAAGGSINSGDYIAGSSPGSYTVTVSTASGREADTARVTVASVASRTLLVVRLEPAIDTIIRGATQQYRAVARFDDGSTEPVNATFSTSGGTISDRGEFTGTAAGVFNVIATAEGGVELNASVVVVDAPSTTASPTASSLTLTPSTVSLAPNASQDFEARAAYSDGSIRAASVSFSVSGSGSITSSGSFTAGAVPGTATITASSLDGSLRATATVLITSSSASSPAAPGASGVLFADDFATGDLSKSANGWRWNRTESVDVVRGFSRDGASGNSARFVFDPAKLNDGNAWSELRFQIGSPAAELWTTFWIYYPSGQESTYRGPRFMHRGQSTGATNNKFFMIFDQYDGYYAQEGLSTWADGNGDGSLIPGARVIGIDAPMTGKNFWDTRSSLEIDAARGRWVKMEIFATTATSAAARDGILEVYQDGAQVISMRNLNTYATSGINLWREGYLLGWANSGFDTTTYVYVSNVSFSTGRIR